MPPKKKQKIECLECGSVFDQYYRKTHNEKKHSDLISQHRHVRFKFAGAPEGGAFFKVKPSESSTSPEGPKSPEQHQSSEAIEGPSTSSAIPSHIPGAAAATHHEVRHEQCDSESSDNEESEEEHTDNREVNPDTNETILTCAGKVRRLTSAMEVAKDILEKVSGTENINILHRLHEMEEFANDIVHKGKVLHQACGDVKGKLEKDIQSNVSEADIDEAIVSCDPSVRPQKLSLGQKQYLIHAGPNQPKLPVYPRNKDIKKGKQDRFNSDWYLKYPHLEYSTRSDAVYCFVCSLFPTGPDREKSADSWTEKGVRTWHRMMSVGKLKEGKLAQHFSSRSHKAALGDYIRCESGGDIQTQLDSERRKLEIQKQADLSRNREVVSILMDISRTLSKLGLPFRAEKEDDGNFMQIAQLISRHNTVLKHWFEDRAMRSYHVTYCSKKSQEEYISLLADFVRQNILDQVKASDFFAVMADTTPDVTHQDRISCCVRFVDGSGTAIERLIELKELLDKSGEGHATSLLDSVEKNGLDSGKIVFQSYDYTSSMSGVHNGAQKKLSEKLNREIPYIPCQAHRTNTVTEHSINASALIKSMFDVLESLFVFFSGSTKRHSILSEKLSVIENSLQLRNLSKTRWTARAESIKSVWISYELIVEALTELGLNSDSKDTKFQAQSLLTKLHRFDFLFAIMFMKNIMWKTKIMTEQMQEESLNIMDALCILSSTIDQLKAMNSDESEMNNLIEAAKVFAKKLDIDAEADYSKFHRPRKPPRRIDENPSSSAAISMDSFYRKEIKCVLDVLTIELTENHKKCLSMIEPFSVFYPPVKVPSDTQIDKICKLLPDSLRFDSDSLKSEVDVFMTALKNYEDGENSENLKTLRDISNFAHKHQGVLPLINRCYNLILTAPVTTAKNERSFSKLKLLKNFLRSRCSDDRLDSLMILFCERDVTENIPISDVVDQWVRLRERRIAF